MSQAIQSQMSQIGKALNQQKPGSKSVIDKYIDDEYVMHSFILAVFSIMSYYPVIVLFTRQHKTRMGTRPFDQTLIYAIMVIILFHFLSEQNCLKDYSFIPLANWHKLINVFLLIEQCSVVLYLGRVSNVISQSTEQTMFGFNIILILIM